MTDYKGLELAWFRPQTRSTMNRHESESANCTRTAAPSFNPQPASRDPQIPRLTRRQFLAEAALLTLAVAAPGCKTPTEGSGSESIIDIHQHLGYSGRSDEALLAHQRAMGVSRTVLLPAGRPVNSASTHNGLANGLQAQCLGNAFCYRFAKAHPRHYWFAACEVPDLPDAPQEIEKYLKLGGVAIAELKFGVECDSPEMQTLYQVAADYRVPVLMHWQYQMYSYGFERFHKMLEKYPNTTFIGHAQTWWANIDKTYRDQSVLYPKGKVTPGGITDRYLSDYPNMYGDLSAGSGLNAFTRDEDHAREFIQRHQDKLMYGSDCNDLDGQGSKCSGAQMIAAVRRLAPSKDVQRKLLCTNAKQVFRI
jgi:predicted TIM-barrel fold metal-dependent hydrolase